MCHWSEVQSFKGKKKKKKQISLLVDSKQDVLEVTQSGKFDICSYHYEAFTEKFEEYMEGNSSERLQSMTGQLNG